MARNIWLISRCCLAGCAALAPIGSGATAAELFPYNPPPANAAGQMQQRAPQRTVELSAEELRKVDEFAKEIGKLPRVQKQGVRTKVRDELDKAAKRSDLQRVRYYSELLRRIDNGG